jgi:hypothetical protein
VIYLALNLGLRGKVEHHHCEVIKAHIRHVLMQRSDGEVLVLHDQERV